MSFATIDASGRYALGFSEFFETRQGRPAPAAAAERPVRDSSPLYRIDPLYLAKHNVAAFPLLWRLRYDRVHLIKAVSSKQADPARPQGLSVKSGDAPIDA